MSYLANFGYDETYFNNLLIDVIENDITLKDQPAMKEALLNIISNGGKRIRPLFLLLGSDLNPNTKKEDVYLACVAIELLHISSLIHDDIIDQSSLRRNTATLHTIFDKTVALRLGNYTLNKSLSLFSHFKIPTLHLALAKTMEQLCIGEFNQQKTEFNFDLTIDEYIEKSYQKTGTLIATSLMIGGLLADVSPETLTNLEDIGKNIGIAYQLLDDILDFTSDQAVVGKPIGNDLRNGVVTIPTIFALNDDLLKDDLLTLNSNVNDSQFDLVCDRIKNSNHIQRSHELCASYTEKAKECISLLPTDNKRFFSLVCAMLSRQY
ncbi:MAG: polyprenyl synthetase family protein [Turicibacter sp.]